jgi:uncharacterized membrane protein YbhN (UPF0104 family)
LCSEANLANGKTILKYSLHAGVILGVVWAAVKSIDGDAFSRALHDFDWRYAPFVGLLGVASVFIKAWRFAGMLRQVSDLDRWTAIKAYVAGQSMTLLPGGIAARAGLLQQVGVPLEKSSPAITLSSVTDQLGFLLCGIVAALWFEEARKPVMILLAILATVALLLGFEAVRTWLSGVIEAILGRFNFADKWRGFVEGMSKTVNTRIIALGVANTLFAFTCLVTALGLCMAGIGHSLHPLTLLLAFAVPTMLGRISALPGGFGVTEVGMVGVLDHAPGVSLNEAAAAVLVFRLGTVVFSAMCGGILYFTAWRHDHKDVGGKAVAA